MGEKLLSVGLDVGTTSTQLIVSQLEIENRASGFAVPEMTISQRHVLYKSPIYFTPLLGDSLVDGDGIRTIVEREYAAAGITRQQIDTGAIIITGETSRKENAAAVLSALSDYAGEFVVATAGPDLESVLAAKGAGAVTYSEKTGKTVLHMDIGGGTSNLALIENGQITTTACFNVGGRLIKLDDRGNITYLSPVLQGITDLHIGQRVTETTLEPLAQMLVQILEMAASLQPRTPLMEHFVTADSQQIWAHTPENTVISFSGGVADCIQNRYNWLQFGDLGSILGQAIRNSRLCRGAYILGTETIRATVIGAGCHSAQLSGSTVYSRDVTFPLKNLPVVQPKYLEETAIRDALSRQEGPCILAFPGEAQPSYKSICNLADLLCKAIDSNKLYLAMETDMAKALGQALALRLPQGEILSIDRIRLAPDSYLDVGAPVGPALPVIVKTLILSERNRYEAENNLAGKNLYLSLSERSPSQSQ